jgi:lipid II:glycine glycyltransferase (peptidoglycan interpeptide bridge formation enzyme)
MIVKTISADEHLRFIASQPSVSFLQTPAWGKTKFPGWTYESLGWFADDKLVGAGLVLLRKVPKLNRYLAYLPEGPSIAWANPNQTQDALNSLIAFAKSKNVFQIKIGPHAWTQRWNSETLKDAIANNKVSAIGKLPADEISQSGIALVKQLRDLGWKQPATEESGFGDFQPRYVFQLNIENRTEEEILNSFNQLWRRNIRKAEKEGVTVRVGTRDDLPIFHACYVETAARDKFRPRSLAYFESMWDAMKNEADMRINLFIAEHPAHAGAIAATTLTQVGDHAWYSYGASTTAARDLRPSNAIQWAMIKHSCANGAKTYDMRGISDTLSTDNHLFGLIQFKLGTGGYAQEYVGEWDYDISPMLAKAFSIYMARR